VLAIMIGLVRKGLRAASMSRQFGGKGLLYKRSWEVSTQCIRTMLFGTSKDQLHMDLPET
jgi:hypothetical protein